MRVQLLYTYTVRLRVSKVTLKLKTAHEPAMMAASCRAQRAFVLPLPPSYQRVLSSHASHDGWLVLESPAAMSAGSRYRGTSLTTSRRRPL